MTRRLRNVHYVAWRSMAVLVPLLFIISLAMKPRPVETETQEDFEVNLVQDDGGYVLKIEVPSNTTHASCVVRVQVAHKMKILGNLEGPGEHTLFLPKDDVNLPLKVELFDTIRGKLIKTFRVNLTSAQP